MASDFELPGEAPAPASGIYELLNVLGAFTGTRTVRTEGEPLPPTPIGWSWRRTTDTAGGAAIIRELERLLLSRGSPGQG